VLGAVGVVATAALLIDGWARELTWVTGFQGVDDPLYSWIRPLLPDYRDMTAGGWIRHGLWLALLTVLAVAGWRQARVATSDRHHGHDPHETSAPDSPAPTSALTSA
ncbi:MAG: hypothetical protein ACRDWY_19240, partial [Actinomycetes bacterium]